MVEIFKGLYGKDRVGELGDRDLWRRIFASQKLMDIASQKLMHICVC